MSETTISRFAVPELADLADDVRARILAVQEKAGFVPNVFLMLAHRPAEFRAFFDYHDTLMEKDVGLSKAEREMIVVATSGANNCLYCVVAHGAVLRIRAKNPRVADQLATNYRKAEITARQRAMLDFAMCRRPMGPGRGFRQDMRLCASTALEHDTIWDIGAITAFFSMSNRLASYRTAAHRQSYPMGRLPKG
ncbi:MAG: peroxidase-related enzyme [Rhodocyclaceae bacterium]